MMDWENPMGRALLLADRAREHGDVPVGAVVVDARGEIVGKGWNRRVAEHDPTAHAEIMALRDAGKRLGTWNLEGCSLIVTLEPCTMCAGAIVNARIGTLVFAAWDEKAGAAGSLRDVVRDSRLNHQVEVVSGVLGAEANIQLTSFFKGRRVLIPSKAKGDPSPDSHGDMSLNGYVGEKRLMAARSQPFKNCGALPEGITLR